MKKQQTSHRKVDSKALNLCCYEIREALIDLYINVKVRNDTSINDLTESRIEGEKDQIRHLDGLELVEYIKAAIEVLVSLKDEDDRSSSRNLNPNDTSQSSMQDISLQIKMLGEKSKGKK